MVVNVFVYGTLKRGFYNHGLLKNSEFISTAISISRYPMVNTEGYFPYLINDKGNGHYIKGEVFRVDDLTLEKLDRLEGYPDHYTREFIGLDLGETDITAISYFVKNEIDYKELELLDEF